MNKKWIAAAAVYIGLVATCCIVIYAVPSVKGMLEKTYIAEYGRIDVKDDVSAFVVRDETVYVAAQPSIVNRIADADKLVKANTRVVELVPDENAASESDSGNAESGRESTAGDAKAEQSAKGSEDGESGSGDTGKYGEILAELGNSVKTTKEGYNKEAGYVSYYVDGAEAKLTTAALDTLRYRDFKALTGRKAVEAPDKECGSGYPVFKITRNSRWYLVFYLDNKAAAKYVPGAIVTVDMNGTPVEVNVENVLAGSKNSKITLSCKTFFDGFLEMRNLETTVTAASAEGLILEDSSIVEAADGRTGVFVKNKLGKHIFTPIKKKADNGEKCVVFSDIYVDENGNYVETLGTYDEIVSEPGEEDLAGISGNGGKEDSSKEKKTNGNQ